MYYPSVRLLGGGEKWKRPNMTKGYITTILVLALLSPIIVGKFFEEDCVQTLLSEVKLAYNISDITYSERAEWWGLLKYQVAIITVKNIDNKTGTFGVEFVYVKDSTPIGSDIVKHEIEPGTIEIFETKIPEGAQVTYLVQVPTKIQYTQVQTKCKKSLLDYLVEINQELS